VTRSGIAQDIPVLGTDGAAITNRKGADHRQGRLASLQALHGQLQAGTYHGDERGARLLKFPVADILAHVARSPYTLPE
jgi:hypothetical protein